MMFTSLTTALIAAGIAIPSLLLLYFLKLKRQQRVVPSTLLWKRAVQDMQVNAPFQKLRKNLLLFLQLLILLALLFALAGPVANFRRPVGQNVVILVDRSGSMRAVEGDGRTRLEHAKAAASAFVRGLKSGSKAMVIAFSDRAEVVCAFTGDITRIVSRIDDIEPTDGASRIGEALQLAVAYSTQTSVSAEAPEGGWVPPSDESADIELFSDGRLADAEKEFVTRGNLTFHRIGAASDNVGIVAFDVRRDIERPGIAAIFAQVENFGPAPVTTDVSLSIDGGRPRVQEVVLGASRSATTQPGRPGEMSSAQNLVFEVEQAFGGIVEIKVHRTDALEIDNVVVAPMDPPREIRILSVSDRTEVQYYMRRAFQIALEINDFTTMTTAEYESAAASKLSIDGRSAFDLIVIDKHDTDRLWPGNYIFLAGIPKIESITRGAEDVEEQVFVNWNDAHPLLRHVPLDRVVALRWQNLNLPSHAVRLIEGENSAAMAFITDPGHRYIICAFDLLETNFFKRPAMIIFLQNAVSYLAAGGLAQSGRLIRPGETVAMQVPPGASKLTIVSPAGRTDEIDVTGRQNATYARTGSRGLYRARFNDPAATLEVFAVNVLDPIESQILPADAFSMGSGQVSAADDSANLNQPLWHYAAIAALAILLFEWWIYNRRVMI